ncbi:MAG: hypothetical protein RMM58_09750 [Chloroflexota bacterium]|nr:hypothetical protein [Dehalococcoidia bacterium]MDW8254152.1 hypothetical protein [Chloroflexota bacterium]
MTSWRFPRLGRSALMVPRPRHSLPAPPPSAAAPPLPSTAVAPPQRRWLRRLTLAATLVAIAIVHLWIVSGGRWSFESNPSGSHYGKQAAAFLAGQLALLDRPPPELLALPDPYDGRAWLRVMTTQDLSLFGDRFYLYFGPFPAILLALGMMVGLTVADGVLGLAFDLAMVALFAAAAALLRQRVVATGSWALDRLLLLSFGLSAPVLFALARLRVYETAIAGGQALLLLGLVLGLLAASLRARWLLLAAGLSLGLAAATRLSLVPALIVVALLLAALQPQRWRAAGTVLLPLAAALLLLGWYNAARFGSPFETGLQYALTTLPHRALMPDLFALSNLAVTVPWYGWRPPLLSWAPPFLFPGRITADEWILLQSWYIEPWGMTGLIWCAPILGLGLAAAAVAAARRDRRLLLAAGLAVAAIAAAAPILLYRALYWRYYLDFLPLALLAAAVPLQIVASVSRWRAATAAAAGALTLWTVLFGIAIGVAERNTWAGFAEADSLVARAARLAPAVAAVADALQWIGGQSSERTVALIAEPLPGTPATIDIGTPVHVDVVVADPQNDPCWALSPGPGVAYLIASEAVGEPLARFAPPLGPPAIVSRPLLAAPPPLPLRPGQTALLCPFAVNDANAAPFGADFARRFRSRAFRAAGEARYQPLAPTGPFAIRVLAYGIPAEGHAPALTVEVRRQEDDALVGSALLTIDQDYRYRWYEARFPDPAGPVTVSLRYDDDGRWRPWWAISLARVVATGG